jgi:hypothetical protein
MTKRNGDDRAHFDAKVQRAALRLIDEVMNSIALGMRQGITARVADMMTRPQIERLLIEVARGSALRDIDGAKLADNIIDRKQQFEIGCRSIRECATQGPDYIDAAIGEALAGAHGRT